MHSLTADGLDAIQDGLDSIAIIVYNGQRISPQMWKLYPQLLFVVVGDQAGGGFGQEYFAQVGVCIQNYISKDPDQFLSPLPGGTEPVISLTFKFLERCLELNRNSETKQDALVIMKLFIAIVETLRGRIDDFIAFVVQTCMQELQQRNPKNAVLMILQTVSMCFWYNSQLTFHVLEQSQMTVPFFASLMKKMSSFKRDFELRRIIFGLASIVGTPPHTLPAIVNERMPEIVKQLAMLSMKARDDRLNVLKDNEKYVEKTNKKLQDGFEDEEEESNEDDHSDSDESEREFRENLAKIQKLKRRMNKKKHLGEEEDDDQDEDGEDSDYEYVAGDLAIYDSALDNVDELVFIKEILERISQAD